MPVIATDNDLTVRTMRDDDADYGLLVRWRAQPHVHGWWEPDEPVPDLETVRTHYGPRARAEDPTTSCIIELDRTPIGYLQFYRWLGWPEEAAALEVDPDEDTFGIDIFIGEPELIGRGIGTRAVALVCDHLERDHGATAVALTTESTNVRAQRAYEKAGFRKVREVLDTDTRDGQRIPSWLMVRSPAIDPAPPE
ncbi:MAG TPA: GNAT family N-acetyltransferase [Actinomycetota bacterium]|nr:GNAT family N-acetyltransferase [Actinomycetota bacterium]